ncbi:hypothetical protein ACKVWC_008209 [Pyricularia oryzae]
MEERGNIPVSLPVKNPTRSYWQDPPDQVIANLRSSPDLTQDADVVMIGSGITGAAIAWHLLQDDAEGPKPKVVVLEARETCSGATGRNGKRAVVDMAMNRPTNHPLKHTQWNTLRM